MSFIAGAYRLDNSPIEQSLLTPWQNLNTRLNGPIGFAQIAPRRPFFDPDSRCSVVFDGKLDNREDLTTTLSGYPHLLQQQSDEAYILAAYLRWGDDTARHLLGDFAFAVWNAPANKLFLARDPLGIRPLYYSISSGYFVFASTVEILLKNPLVSTELKEETALWYLYDGNSGLEKDTFYKHIYFLPGSQQIRIHDKQIHVSAYYKLPEHPPGKWPPLAEVRAEFRALLSKVIRDHTRGGNGSVGLMLSGGVDSSSLACVAADLKIPLHAYSLVFDQYPEMDERKYSTAVSSHYGFPHTLVHADDCTAFAKFNEWLPFFTDPCFNPFDATTFKIMAQARSDGKHIMLMGHGGDHILNGNARYLADWFVSARWRDLHEQVQQHARQWNRSYLRAFLVNALYPLSPSILQRRIESRRWSGATRWVPDHLPKQYRFPRILNDIRSGPHGWWYSLRSQLLNIANSPHSHMVRLMELFGMQLRLPFFDIRLVEFILRTPPEAIYRNGMIKMILRESLADILPSTILERRDKAAFVPLVHAGLQQRRLFLEGLLQDSELERRGYVIPQIWKQDVKSFLTEKTPPHWAPWRSLTLEMWLRHREGRLPALES
jgi:asparagine synthase (glutamine-hydrolysing)